MTRAATPRLASSVLRGYHVVGRIAIGDAVHEVGSVVEFDEATAAPLLATQDLVPVAQARAALVGNEQTE